MPWFKIDDNLAFHHKVIAAGNTAMGMWVRAGSMSASQLTDGFIPDHMVAALGGKALASRLTACGLWVREDGGYRFHEWLERQPSREQVEAERAAARERMSNRRKKSHGTSQEVPANTDRTSAGVQLPRPDPTRPDQETTAAPRQKRAHRAPADFIPNDTNRRIATECGVPIDRVVAQFLDHHRAKGSTYVDWHLALNTWIRREKPTSSPRPTRKLPTQHELPPDGLSPQQYAEWEYAQRQKRAKP